MQIIHMDKDILVCIKPAGLLSTDEPGGLPELLRQQLGSQAQLRTVHRLDRAVGGLMVLGLRKSAAAELSRQIREGEFGKQYLAVVHGLTEPQGSFCDLMYRDKGRKMSFVTKEPGLGVQQARLGYETLAQDKKACISLARIELYTGRTHQIRCQFSAHGFPLLGERKYSLLEDDCGLALWSFRLSFKHPYSGEPLVFCQAAPAEYPWFDFDEAVKRAVNLFNNY